MLYSGDIATPLGEMTCLSADDGICLLSFLNQPNLEELMLDVTAELSDKMVHRVNKHITSLRQQLAEYFNSERTEFAVPLLFVGTPFQIKVWEAIRNIPFGKTSTYGQLARLAGNRKAIRAAGGATGKNKLTIIVPCHRVVGAKGEMTGYAGGIDRKRQLLEMERTIFGPRDLFTSNKK